MIIMICYVLIFYNIDKLFQTQYLQYFIYNNNELISSNNELYFLLKLTSYFMLILYLFTILYKLYKSNIINKTCYGLSFVYMKHIIDIIITPKMTIMEYELSRSVMWAFTTPLMLKMYCDINNISIWDINIHYHLIAIISHIFFIPFKNNSIYLFATIIFSIPEIFFLKSLYKYKKLSFTHLYITIWIMFISINLLDIVNICNPIVINGLYNIADTLSKFICHVVISNYNEQEIIISENMDLQSVKFISHMIKSIKQFEDNNTKLTSFSKNIIKYYKQKFINKIPTTNEKLKLELLTKILPLDFDKDYIINNMASNNIRINKEFNFICVMFMDIVNYTELAKRYKNGDIIFKLLDNVYYHFDNIIKKYLYLQKIETIGDAYMVVGDIFRDELNYKNVVKEIILLALEFIKEIKTIKTPDNIPLCIRIGINIGNVNIGILGNEIPRLCVVGNTVNVAARLQSTADSDTIQMSRHIYEFANEIDFGINIEYIEKDNVFLKNIGSITTYNIKPNNE